MLGFLSPPYHSVWKRASFSQKERKVGHTHEGGIGINGRVKSLPEAFFQWLGRHRDKMAGDIHRSKTKVS
jgi:hypothetical protein